MQMCKICHRESGFGGFADLKMSLCFNCCRTQSLKTARFPA